MRIMEHREMNQRFSLHDLCALAHREGLGEGG